MLSEAQIERYARHILLREVGGVGQERLLRARVQLEGLAAGGWLVAWLALAGVGELALVDGGEVGDADVVPLLRAADRGRRRDEAMAAALPAFNPDVRAVVGAAAASDLVVRQGLPGAPDDAVRWIAAGDRACVVAPRGLVCAACLADWPDAAPTPAAAALAGSLAGGEALLALLGRAKPGRPMLLFRGGEPVACPHGRQAPAGAGGGWRLVGIRI